MQAQRLKATYVVLILCVVLGSAVAVESMLTRGGQRLAAKAEEHAALYTDSDGKTWPLGTHAPRNSGTREKIHHPDSVHAGDSKAAAGGHHERQGFSEPVASLFRASSFTLYCNQTILGQCCLFLFGFPSFPPFSARSFFSIFLLSASFRWLCAIARIRA